MDEIVIHVYYGVLSLAGGAQGLIIMVTAGAATVLLRAWCKKHIGDPFFKETMKQSVLKDLILALGMTVYFYGHIDVMVGGFPRVFIGGQYEHLALMGVGFYAAGILYLMPLRAWARRNQKYGVM